MMNPRRRQVLHVLGIGGVTSLAGCSLGSSSSPSEETTHSNDNSASNSNSNSINKFDTTSRIQTALDNQAQFRPEYPFDYDSIESEFEGDKLFKHIKARPAQDQTGDFLQLQPGSRSASSLAELLRAIWNVGSSQTTTTPINGSSAELNGGSAFGTTFLVGTTVLDEIDTVIVVRGESLEVARSHADSSPFPL